MSETKHLIHDITSPGWRLLAAVLLIGGCWGFAVWFEELGILEYAATVLVVATFHVLFSIGNNGGNSTPSGRMARVLDPIKHEFPFLEVWLTPGSVIIETIKGLAKGGAVVLAQQIFIWGSAIFLAPIFGIAVAAVIGAIIIMPTLLNPLKKAVGGPAKPSSTDVVTQAADTDRGAA